jgi:Quinohemoprotein amine dehydrogenase A, alpha subunit, haem binding
MPFGSMWRSRLARSVTALVLGVALGWGGGWATGMGDRVGPSGVSAQDTNPLPRDRDQQMVSGRCIICHSLEMIAQQRQTREEWAVIVDRMITYGMPVQPDERERILTYLARYLRQ